MKMVQPFMSVQSSRNRSILGRLLTSWVVLLLGTVGLEAQAIELKNPGEPRKNWSFRA